MVVRSDGHASIEFMLSEHRALFLLRVSEKYELLHEARRESRHYRYAGSRVWGLENLYIRTIVNESRLRERTPVSPSSIEETNKSLIPNRFTSHAQVQTNQ